ncbi:MAG TPA: protein kinase [Thermoanaerobaculia bacterium]|jgi:Tol biopolymer transport system component/tRNA A-37 threonylcarbamoyl transferase component Bud32
MSVARESQLPAGVELERYRVESLLALGGMSEVYVARDNILGRRVALKVLRDPDRDRVQRFIREAEAASSLDHPAIVAVHDSGTAEIGEETVRYLAMELVDGQTLAAWAKATRDRRRRLEVMAGVADGLARAHGHGIIHRDLKPDNIMVARGGYPKILDFGVAKLTERAASDDDTAADALLGTVAYMSPEQAERRVVDRRSDIFSFGAVLYEVMCDTPAFKRATTVDTLHAIAHEMPPFDRLEPALARIVRRCLAKSPEERYDSMHDVALDLRELAQAAVEVKRRTTMRILVPLLLVVVAFSSWMSLRESRAAAEMEPAPPAPPAMTMERLTNNGKTFTGAVSPDGRFVVYGVRDGETQTLWIKQIATNTAARLRPAERVYYGRVMFAPDGNYIYYSAAVHQEPNVFDLYRVPAIGGEPQKLAADMEGGFAVSPDGKEIAFRRFNAFVRDSVVFLYSVEQRSERELLRKKYPDMLEPVSWIPKTNELAMVWYRPTPRVSITFLAHDVVLQKQRAITTPEWRRVVEARGMGSYLWLPDGSGSVATVSIERQAPQIWWAPAGGAPLKITADVSSYSDVTVTADSSTLVAVRADASSNLWIAPVGASAGEGRPRALTTGAGNRYGNGGLAWTKEGIVFTNIGSDGPRLNLVDANGTIDDLGSAISAWMPSVSADGTRLTYMSDHAGGGVNVWVADTNGARATQVTRTDRVASPQFLPDGKSLLFVWGSREQTLWRTSLDGKEMVQLTTAPTFNPTLSRDGKWILCRLRSNDGKNPLWRTTLLTSEGKFVRELPIPRFGNGPIFRWLPDGRIAYVDFKDGVSNIWAIDREGKDPRQLTFFEEGSIYAFTVSPDGRSLALSRGDPVSDLVLIRHFR